MQVVAEAPPELAAHVAEAVPMHPSASGQQQHPRRFDASHRDDIPPGAHQQRRPVLHAHCVSGDDPIPLLTGLQSPEAHIREHLHVGVPFRHRQVDSVGRVAGRGRAEPADPAAQALRAPPVGLRVDRSRAGVPGHAEALQRGREDLAIEIGERMGGHRIGPGAR